MAAPKPDPQRVKEAINIYLAQAYDGPPPVNVRSLLRVMESWGGDFYECPIFAPDDARPPTKYTARLGNRQYPHMKLVLQISPSGDRWLFRADSHDRHCCPPAGSPEYDDFCALIEQNQRTAERIEAAWDAAGFPTFKAYLKEDLAQRAAEAG